METTAKEEATPSPVKNKVDLVTERTKFVPGEDENKVYIKSLVGIAIDMSEHSRRAFDWYMEHMHRPENRIALIHCHSIPDIEVSSDEKGQLVVSSKWKQMATESFAKCQDLLNEYKELCEAKKIHLGSKQSHKIGVEILEIVEQRGIQWVIMGSRGLDTIRRTILGSVSDYLLHHSSVPVTIVPPP